MATRTLLIICFAVFLTGCAATKTGNLKIDVTGRYLLLNLGKSTKKEVYLAFGQPHYVLYPPSAANKSAWVYVRNSSQMSGWTLVPYIGMLAGGANVETKMTEFVFQSNDVLENLSTNEEGGYKNMWAVIASSASDDGKEWQVPVKDEMEKYKLPYSEMISK